MDVTKWAVCKEHIQFNNLFKEEIKKCIMKMSNFNVGFDLKENFIENNTKFDEIKLGEGLTMSIIDGNTDYNVTKKILNLESILILNSNDFHNSNWGHYKK